MLLEQKSGIASMALGATNIGTRTQSQLKNGMRTLRVHVRISATVTVTVAAATAIRNGGSVLSLFDAIGIDEAGVDRVYADARSLRFYSEMNSSRGLSSTRLSSLAVGVYNISESVFILFSSPLTASPIETAFVERDPRQALNLWVQYNGATSKLYNAGAATVALSNVTVTAEQSFDTLRNEKPALIPFIRQITQPITSTVTTFPIYLKTTRYLRALTIQQDDATVGEVTDILSALALRGDYRDIIGPQPVSIANMQAAAELEFGGNVGVTASPSYLGFNFAKSGRLSNIINPANDVNLRCEVNAAVSAASGATASSLRFTLFELESVPGLTRESLPFKL